MRCYNYVSGCIWRGSVGTLKKHAATCVYTLIACKHESIGCGTKLTKKDMAAHEKDNTLHLHMAINTITQMKKEDIAKKNTLKQRESRTFKLVDFQARKERNEYFTTSPVYTSQGYHMAFRVYANGSYDSEGTHVSVHALIVKGKHDSQLKWPLLGSVKISLLNQLENSNHRYKTFNLTEEDDTTVGGNWGVDVIPHSKLELGYDPVEKTQYLKDDTLYFRVEVEVDDYKPWLECTANS